MEIFVLLLMLPGLLLFDWIPKLFKYKGLTDWYCDKYNKEADPLIILYVLFAFVLITVISYIHYH